MEGSGILQDTVSSIFLKKQNTDYKINLAQSSLMAPKHVWWWLCLQSLCPLPIFSCFGLVRTFLGWEWVHFPQEITAGRWGLEWIRHSNWTPFRVGKMEDVDLAAKKRKCGSSEERQHAHKAHSRMRVNLGLAFTRFWALRERPSWSAFCWISRCQTSAVSLC